MAAVVAIVAGVWFKISAFEWIVITFAIVLVLVLEIINSAIEKLADLISPGKSDTIRIVKDITAAAVLLAAIASLVIAAIIFIPKIEF